VQREREKERKKEGERDRGESLQGYVCIAIFIHETTHSAGIWLL
jgi:hypothetical protein